MKKSLLLLFLIIGRNCYSQTILSYNFAGMLGNESSVPVGSVASNSSSTVLTRSGSLGVPAASGPTANTLNSSSWGLTTTLDNLKFLTFTFTPSITHQLNVTNFEMTLQRTATGPANIVVSYQNSGDAEVFTPVNSLSGTTDTPFSIPINFINNGAPIVFKIYGYNGTAAGGHLRLKSLTVTGSVPLPVNLTNFTGKNKPASVSLNWSTASETNFSHFVVQRSRDAKGFESIGKIESKGFETENNQYSFNDEKPFSGNNYYRLKMVDKDGTEDYSKMINVNFDGKATPVFYPNPSQDFVKFENIKTEEIKSVLVHKINGEFLGEIRPSADGLDISTFKTRELILQLTMKNNQIFTSRIIKNL